MHVSAFPASDIITIQEVSPHVTLTRHLAIDIYIILTGDLSTRLVWSWSNVARSEIVGFVRILGECAVFCSMNVLCEFIE